MSQQDAEDARPVLAVVDVGSPPQAQSLGYASPREFERAIFRFVGWVAIVVASMTLLLVVIELLQVRKTILPEWWTQLVLRPFRFNPAPATFQLWTEGAVPLMRRVLVLLLLAGGIGCTRRHAKTRWWMISYAVLSILLELTTVVAYIWYAQWRAYYSFGRRTGDPSEEWALGIFGVLEERWAFFVLPIVILWLMTRPRVGELFAKHRG